MGLVARVLCRTFRLVPREKPLMSTDPTPPAPVTDFDDIARDGQEPASHLIGAFDYLNASGRPEAAAVRTLIDQWLAEYPVPN